MSEWLLGFIGIGVQPSLGMIALGLIGLIVVGVVFSLVLWPRSRRWKRTSQLHALAVRNQKEIRLEIESQIDASICILTRARKNCEIDGIPDFDDLIHQMQLARDHVAASYVPGPANAPGLGGGLDLRQIEASSALLSACQDLEAKGEIGVSQSLNFPEIEDLLKGVIRLGNLLP